MFADVWIGGESSRSKVSSNYFELIFCLAFWGLRFLVRGFEVIIFVSTLRSASEYRKRTWAVLDMFAAVWSFFLLLFCFPCKSQISAILLNAWFNFFFGMTGKTEIKNLYHLQDKRNSLFFITVSVNLSYLKRLLSLFRNTNLDSVLQVLGNILRLIRRVAVRGTGLIL